MAFSPNGTTARHSHFNGRAGGTWPPGKEIGTLTGHTATGHVDSGWEAEVDDGTILLWDMSPYVTTQPLASDFDGDGTVGFPDFLQFAAQVGLSQGDAGYDARFDLNGDFGDFVIFARSFGQGS